MTVFNATINTRVVFNHIPRIESHVRILSMIATKAGFPEGGMIGPQTKLGSGRTAWINMQEAVEVALKLEFGPVGPKGKSWPFMTQAFLSGVNDLKKESVKEYKKVVHNTVNPLTAMSNIGKVHEKQIKDQIRTTTTPTLEPFTVDRKNSDKPLIDSSQMLNTVQHKEVLRR